MATSGVVGMGPFRSSVGVGEGCRGQQRGARSLALPQNWISAGRALHDTALTPRQVLVTTPVPIVRRLGHHNNGDLDWLGIHRLQLGA